MATASLQKNPRKILGDSLIPHAARLGAQAVGLPSQRLEARRLIRENVPRIPGIYGYVDRNQRLIYVGKSKSLRHRLLSYQAKKPPDAKMVRIIQQAKGFVWEGLSHELLALIREQELISRWRPVCNSQGQPQRRQPAFIRVDRSPAPSAALSRRVIAGDHEHFGPIIGTKELGESIVSLNYAFQLRDCQAKTPMHFGDQLELFPQLRNALCIRHELGSCTAPCAGECSAREYQQQAARALAFLKGDDLSMLSWLQTEMFAAAKRQAFERAAIYRNQFDHLDWLNRRLEGLRRARRDLHGLFSIPGFDHTTLWLVLHTGTIQSLHVTHSPSAANRDDDGLEALQRHARTVALDTRTRIPETSHEIFLQMILISWFRKHPTDKYRIIPFEDTQQLVR